MQVKVAQGVKESEISYQVAFSKQELRQVIREYPAREVKKGLDHLYKKVDKHLCEEENLLQVGNVHMLVYSCTLSILILIILAGSMESHARRIYSTIQVNRGFDSTLLSRINDMFRIFF